MFCAKDNARLLEWLAKMVPPELVGAGPRQLAFTACALVNGPQYPRLADVVRVEADPVRLASQITEIYAEATA